MKTYRHLIVLCALGALTTQPTAIFNIDLVPAAHAQGKKSKKSLNMKKSALKKQKKTTDKDLKKAGKEVNSAFENYQKLDRGLAGEKVVLDAKNRFEKLNVDFINLRKTKDFLIKELNKVTIEKHQLKTGKNRADQARRQAHHPVPPAPLLSLPGLNLPAVAPNSSENNSRRISTNVNQYSSARSSIFKQAAGQYGSGPPEIDVNQYSSARSSIFKQAAGQYGSGPPEIVNAAKRNSSQLFDPQNARAENGYSRVPKTVMEYGSTSKRNDTNGNDPASGYVRLRPTVGGNRSISDPDLINDNDRN